MCKSLLYGQAELAVEYRGQVTSEQPSMLDDPPAFQIKYNVVGDWNRKLQENFLRIANRNGRNKIV